MRMLVTGYSLYVVNYVFYCFLGEFGVVYRAKLKRGGITNTVAVKTLKGISLQCIRKL